MNSAAKSVRGRSYISSGAPSCSTLPLVEQEHAIRQGQRLDLIVSDADRADLQPPHQLAQPHPRLLPQLGVEVAQRLVEQEQRRLVDDGARQRHPLLLSARELVRVAPGHRRKADLAQHRVRPLAHLCRRHLAHAQRVLDVLEHGAVRPQRVRLEHEAESALLGGQRRARRAVEEHAVAEPDAALVGMIEPGDGAQQRRLPAPGRTQERDHLAFAQLEGNALEHVAVTQALVHVRDHQLTHGGELPAGERSRGPARPAGR
jgi:hypothetical protein